MRMRLSSKGLLFAFVVTLSCPAVWADPDHSIEVSTNGKKFYYKHLKGLGAKGNVVVKSGQSVTWACKDPDSQCKQLLVTFPSNNPCTSGSLGPAKTITCDGIDPSIFPYIDYKTQVCDDQGKPLPLTDDPEFIVDGNGFKMKNIAFGILAFLATLAGGLFAGYRWGKNQSLPLAR
jgi:hypothetical protein